MPRTDPRTDQTPANPTKARTLRLSLGTPGARWSQRHLAAYIAKNPVPGADGKSRVWIRKVESGEIAGDTATALTEYLRVLVSRESSGEIIPRPKLLEKTPRRS